MRAESPPNGPIEFVRWLATTDNPWVEFVREIVSSALVVLLIGALLFAVSGVWPPLVAVESGSMQPHLYRGDLVFVMSPHRFPPKAAVGHTGVVPYQVAVGTNYRTFGSYGSVIVYDQPNVAGPPIIHRARFWVNKGENWYGKANPNYIRSSECGATPQDHMPNCPAPHAGFITKGDANPVYDQVAGIASPVEPSWVKGTAEFRIPYLGYIRLKFAKLSVGLGAPTMALSTG